MWYNSNTLKTYRGFTMKTYKHFGVMLDCSRNGVMKPEAVKRMIDCLQKMGYNALELYTEDTFEVEGEPYFGYLRGRYTGAELKELDLYAAAHGIELIPCIQTLAHFTCPVKLPRFWEITDVNDILLIDEEKTYAFIDKLFASLAENFTSRNVNIGMDEAHMVGLGRYLDKHGFTNRFELLERHLDKVAEIAKKYGFKPHMWSDMFFRLFRHGEYYGRGVHIPEEVRARVPENVALTYWDYYHREKADYDGMFESHKEFGREIWFAGGAWCWNGFAPFASYSLSTMKPAMESVAEHGIDHVMITMWGDNGKECSFFSLLPVLYSIRQYADGNFDEKRIEKGFFETFGLSYKDFMALELPNRTKKTRDGNDVENPCKSLLFNDCFLGLFDDAMEAEGKIPYGEYAAKLAAAEERAGEYAYIFRCLSKLCSVMEIKADLGVRTRKAYKEGNRGTLAVLAKEDYAVLPGRIKAFFDSFRELWFKENKPFGFEVQEARLGGLMLRVSSCRERLEAYLAGKIDRIEELEEKILPLNPAEKEGCLQSNNYRDIVSAAIL